MLRPCATHGKPKGGWEGAREAAHRVASTITPRLARLFRRYKDYELLNDAEKGEIEAFKNDTIGPLCSMHQLAVAIAKAAPTNSEMALLEENERLRERVAEMERMLAAQWAAE